MSNRNDLIKEARGYIVRGDAKKFEELRASLGEERLDLTGVYIDESFPLQGFDFSHAILHRASFRGARFQQSDFRHADLRGAQLSGVSFLDTQLDGADLRGVSVNPFTRLKNVTFEGIRVNSVMKERLLTCLKDGDPVQFAAAEALVPDDTRF